MARSRTAQAVVSLLLLLVAVALIVTHFMLDAGESKEAPGWIILAAIGTALAATMAGLWDQLLASSGGSRRRRG